MGKYIVIICLLVIPLGCNGSNSYLQSLTDPDIITPPIQSIYFLMPPDSSSFEEKVLAKKLRNEMTAEGFILVDTLTDSDYIITVTIDRKTIPVTYFHTIVSSNYTFGKIGKTNFNMSGSDYSVVPVAGVERQKNIIAGLYKADKSNKNIYQVWQLYVGSDAESFNRSFENLPKLILAFYCRNYHSNDIFLDYGDYYKGLFN